MSNGPRSYGPTWTCSSCRKALKATWKHCASCRVKWRILILAKCSMKEWRNFVTLCHCLSTLSMKLWEIGMFFSVGTSSSLFLLSVSSLVCWSHSRWDSVHKQEPLRLTVVDAVAAANQPVKRTGITNISEGHSLTIFIISWSTNSPDSWGKAFNKLYTSCLMHSFLIFAVLMLWYSHCHP